MLPGMDGLELLRVLRRESRVPVILLSARRGETDRILGLRLGADDYVTKPFSTDELLARVRSTQRRFLVHQTSDSIITCNEIVIDIENFTLLKNNQPLKLTPTEFNLLKYLMLHRNQVLPHTKILKEVWGISYQNEMQYLRTYINALRKKIETSTTVPVYIQTELGIGYRFVCTHTDELDT